MPTQKPTLPPLKTPKSFSFPSEIQDDPKVLSAGEIKREDSSESSIPTPSAYTDFLSALTPVFSTPASAGGNFPRFTFEKGGPSPISQPSSATSPAFSSVPSLKSPAISLPPRSPCNSKSPKSPPALRRLRIPHSIKTLSARDSPLTATPLSATPRSATPRSASTLHSPFSASDWKLRYYDAPRSATTKAVSVRHVVTRTVTYKRTPLDPPPKGKRRKTQDGKAQDCKVHERKVQERKVQECKEA